MKKLRRRLGTSRTAAAAVQAGVFVAVARLRLWREPTLGGNMEIVQADQESGDHKEQDEHVVNAVACKPGAEGREGGR